MFSSLPLSGSYMREWLDKVRGPVLYPQLGSCKLHHRPGEKKDTKACDSFPQAGCSAYGSGAVLAAPTTQAIQTVLNTLNTKQQGDFWIGLDDQ